MQVGGIKLNTFQENFVKELMGDVFMSDSRAEAILTKACKKYNVDVPAFLDAISKNFERDNAEFKKLEAAELGQAAN